MDLFESVRYHPSGVLDDDVSELLEAGGAKYCKYLCGLCKYLIVGKDASDLDIDEALEELKIPAISQDWVRVSAKCGKLIPTAAFSQSKEQLMSGERVFHSKDQLLAGVRVCISGVCAKDRSSIWAMVTFHGGQVDTLLNEATTHLVTTVDRGKYYEEALERKGVFVVTPDWVTDSTRHKIKRRENIYHPRLLITSSVASNGIETMHKEDIQVRLTEETSQSVSKSEQRTIIRPFEKVQSPSYHPRLLITSSVACNGIETVHKEEIQVKLTEETLKSVAKSEQRTIIRPFEKVQSPSYHPRLLITSSVASNGIETMHKEESRVKLTEETSKSVSKSAQRSIIRPFGKVQSPSFEESKMAQIQKNNAFDSLQDLIIPIENSEHVAKPKLAADVRDGALEEQSKSNNLNPSPVRTDNGLGLVSMAYLNSSSEEDSQNVELFPELSVYDDPVGQPIQSEDCAHTKRSLIRKRRKQLDWSDFSDPSEKKKIMPSQPTSKKNENKAKKKAAKIEKFKNRMKNLRGRPKTSKTKKPLIRENGAKATKETNPVRPKRAVRSLPDLSSSGYMEFKTGEPVMALWTNSCKYPAEILSRDPDGSYLVQFYDGYKKALRGHLIRRVQPEDELFIENCKTELAAGIKGQTNGDAKPMELTPEMNIQIEGQNESKTPSDWTGSNTVRPKCARKKRLLVTSPSDSDTPGFNIPMKIQNENEQHSKDKKKCTTNKTKIVKAQKEVVKKKKTELQKIKKQYSKNTKKPIPVDDNQDMKRSRRQRSNIQMKLPAESSYLSPSTSQPDSSCTSTMPLTSVFSLLSERKQPLDSLFLSPQTVPHPILPFSSPDTIPSHLCPISTSTMDPTGHFSSYKAQQEEADKPTVVFSSKKEEVKQNRESSSSHVSFLFPSKRKQSGDYESTPLGINTGNHTFTPTKALADNSSNTSQLKEHRQDEDCQPPPLVASHHSPIFNPSVGDSEPPPLVVSRQPIFTSSVRDCEPPPLVASRHLPILTSSLMPPNNAGILASVTMKLPQNTQISAVTRQNSKNCPQDTVMNQQEFPARELQTFPNHQPDPQSGQQDSLPETSEAKKEMSLSPLDWTVEETIEAVSILDKKLASHVEIFRSQEIDGRALLMLNLEMIIKFLYMKVGPALKLSNIIEKLKRNGGNNN